jgi:hypothetical protein
MSVRGHLSCLLFYPFCEISTADVVIMRKYLVEGCFSLAGPLLERPSKRGYRFYLLVNCFSSSLPKKEDLSADGERDFYCFRKWR